MNGQPDNRLEHVQGRRWAETNLLDDFELICRSEDLFGTDNALGPAIKSSHTEGCLRVSTFAIGTLASLIVPGIADYSITAQTRAIESVTCGRLTVHVDRTSTLIMGFTCSSGPLRLVCNPTCGDEGDLGGRKRTFCVKHNTVDLVY
ncbi:hypothetical protein MTO96_018117 [Rhipicephalus appendiculatus]